MRYRVFASDYDGTIAAGGTVSASTVGALRDVRSSGRRLLLVTGRTLDELHAVFPDVGCFDLVVAENGAVLHDPSGGADQLLGERVPPDFVAELERRGVTSLSAGRSVLSTPARFEATLRAVIRDLGLDLQVVRNRASVMALPTAISKASGTGVALRRLGERPGTMVAVGDAENDIALLRMSGCGVAVADALDSVRAEADVVTSEPGAAGVRQLIRHLVADDLDGMVRPARRRAG